MLTKEKNVGTYLEELASKKPIPSGGGAAALSGAASMALARMVIQFTTGKKKYAQYESRLAELDEKYKSAGARFLELADADEEVFLPLSAAYGLPKETEEQKRHRAQVMELCLQNACRVPMQVLELCAETAETLPELFRICSRIVVSDVGVAAGFLETAASGAFLNVAINAKDFADPEDGKNVYEKAVALRQKAQQQAAEAYALTEQALTKSFPDR